MFARLYQNIVIEKPKLIFTLLILCLIGFGYYTKDFRLDASSDTLLIDGDPDLKYFKSGSFSISKVSDEASNLKSLV